MIDKATATDLQSTPPRNFYSSCHVAAISVRPYDFSATTCAKPYRITRDQLLRGAVGRRVQEDKQPGRTQQRDGSQPDQQVFRDDAAAEEQKRTCAITA